MRTHRLLAIVAVTGLALSSCGGDDSDGTSAAPATLSTADTAAATTAPTSAAASDGRYAGAEPAGSSGATEDAGGATVNVATDDQFGPYLVDADGMALYLFDRDQGTTTACTGPCAQSWPPLVASDGAPTGGDGVDAAALATADGILPDQVTYHGHLLYYFAGDTAPGDLNGVGLPGWWLVDPAGEAIPAD
jgi:predicted lipoprotein with Yx(FWY)xxD motif